MLKTGKDIITGHLLELFSRILSSGKYPTLWSFGLVIRIHKKDDWSKAENYRGITLLSSLGKLFTSILNDQFYDYMIKKGILKAEQVGFKKKGQGPVDSIFMLKTLIDKFVKSKPQKRRNLLFSCFVDFRKAFDRIPRQNLFAKLWKRIKGHVLEIVMSMNSKDKSAVKINTKMTEDLPCYTGVKQSCMLSPTLFNLYLSDLPNF